MTSNEIRKAFLDFFAAKGHTVVPSAPMVIKGDPTLMFTNAGMNQFKDIILGNVQPQWRRAVDSQKCLRVSGKHNDLEEVGHDTYHHTMFEMLGNWSFGDYFKREAIAWAWELLVDVLGIDAGRLYVTIFKGDPAHGVPRDDEAYEFWAQHIDRARILEGSVKDNFWMMGDTGPCGPCSEIHIDLRPDAERAKVPGKELVNRDNPLVIEIWNLVFMQYNRKADGHLDPLPAHHVDTGMGFERLCMVLQGKTSNYDTDVFQPLIAFVAGLAGVSYGADSRVDIALRVVADHTRAVAFSVADGQLPSNNKAGYVIRRILRRAVRYGYSFLGFREPFMCKLVPELAAQMGASYPELVRQKELIVRVIEEEEAAFLRTLEAGIKLLNTHIEGLKAAGKSQLGGEAAFTMYDTFGFPIDLTELILRENGLTVDLEGFDACMAQQKARSRGAAAVTTGDWVEICPGGETEFVGYDTLEAEVHILRMRQVESKDAIQYQLVLNRSPFYAEQGGQVGDTGTLTSANEVVRVLDTIKENGLPICVADRFPDNPEVEFHAAVNAEDRLSTACHHSATHLMHFALRRVLGTHVEQKGSLVEPTHLRFDFSHFQKVTPEELRRVEEMVNRMVRAALPLEEFRSIPIAEAKAKGAMALFGEKYGDRVRMIKFGDSLELCGGTHVQNTGNIGLFRITSESAISAGVRRIEAVCAGVAEQRDYGMDAQLQEIDGLLRGQGNPLGALQRLMAEHSELKHSLEGLRKQQLQQQANALFNAAEKHGNVLMVRGLLQDTAPDDLKELAMAIRAMGPDVAVVLGGVDAGKPSLVVGLADNLVASKGYHAGRLVKEAAKHIQGGGGGQPGFAQAGGKNTEGLQAAVEEAVKGL